MPGTSIRIGLNSKNEDLSTLITRRLKESEWIENNALTKELIAWKDDEQFCKRIQRIKFNSKIHLLETLQSFKEAGQS